MTVLLVGLSVESSLRLFTHISTACCNMLSLSCENFSESRMEQCLFAESCDTTSASGLCQEKAVLLFGVALQELHNK